MIRSNAICSQHLCVSVHVRLLSVSADGREQPQLFSSAITHLVCEAMSVIGLELVK